MKFHALSRIVLLSAVTSVLAQTRVTPSGDASKELEKKVKALQDQVGELQKKRAAMIEEYQREQQAKEDAAKKKRYAKTEIRGKLVKAAALDNAVIWRVAGNDLTLTLRFEGKVDWDLEKHFGKEVVITGRMVAGSPFVSATADSAFPKPPRDMGFNMQLAESYREAKKTYDDLVMAREIITRQIRKTAVDWRGPPAFPGGYELRLPGYDPGIEMPVALVVESLKLAEK